MDTCVEVSTLATTLWPPCKDYRHAARRARNPFNTARAVPEITRRGRSSAASGKAIFVDNYKRAVRRAPGARTFPQRKLR